MEFVWIVLGVAALAAAAVLVISYVCFRMAFYEPDRTPESYRTGALPVGTIYDPYRDYMQRCIDEVNAMPCQEVCITSFDGLKLYGKYYEYRKGAPMEIMFHGYRGSARRDLSGGVQRCFKVGRSALIVSQRCSEKSDGNVITFGINEHRDCLSWIDFAIKQFGPDVKIVLTGISMGAATVLTAAGKPLPENVIGVLADCGYNSPKDIIKKVIKQMGLPPQLGYPFVKLGARLYGRFDLEETSPEEAMKTCTVPVLFIHGEDDDYVPCQMSRINYDACRARKKLVTIPGAGHGLAYPVDSATYLTALREFFGEEASCRE